MNPDTTMAGVYTNLQGFGDLKIAARNNTPEAIRAVASQFEALFVQTMLKSMRDASLGDGLMDSSQSRTYQDLYDKQISLDLASRGDLGFTEMLVRQLGDESQQAVLRPPPAEGYAFHPAQDGRLFSGLPVQPVEPISNFRAAHRHTAVVAPAPLSTSLQTPSEPSVAAPLAKEDSGFDTRQAFIQSLYPYAEQAAQSLGVDPQVLLAQAALETGWGKHMIPRADGSNSYNLFGIKAGQDWQGDRVTVTSLEYEQGVARKHPSAFRAYDSYADSFADYAEFVSSRPRYQQAINTAHDPEAYLRSLQEAGYATDPRYADKIIGILQREEFDFSPPQRATLVRATSTFNEG